MKSDRNSHPHLLMKQVQEELKKAGLGLRDIIAQMGIDYYNTSKDYQLQVMHRLLAKIRQLPQYHSFLSKNKDRLYEQINILFSSNSRRHTYLVDCYKQTVSFPISKEGREICNYSPIFRKNISKELRRILWTRQFSKDDLRQKFVLIDRQVTPYKITEELKMVLEKLAQKEKLLLKNNQKETALRIMEYFVKINHKIPHRYHNYLAIIVVDLFSYYSLPKIVDLGSITLGLIQIADSYREPDYQVRFTNIMKALRIVDEESASYIQSNYIQGVNGKRDLVESYQYFRLTLGASHLNLSICQFLIDQIIVKRFCEFDMYILFSLVILIISDEFDQQQGDKPSLKAILQRAKEIIKPEDYIQAFNTIYEQIPVYHTANDLEAQSNNKLLIQMISYERNEIQDDDRDFVINVDTSARIGSKF